jgi:hypothetical protein
VIYRLFLKGLTTAAFGHAVGGYKKRAA